MTEKSGSAARRKAAVRLVAPEESFPYTLEGSDITVQLRRLNDRVRADLREKATTLENPLGPQLPKQVDPDLYGRLCAEYAIVEWEPDQFLHPKTDAPMKCGSEAKAMLPDEVLAELLTAIGSDDLNYVLSPITAADDELKAEAGASGPTAVPPPASSVT